MVCVLFSGGVEAQVYDLDTQVDIPLVAVPAAISAGWFLHPSLGGPHCSPDCDATDVPTFDRFAAGAYRPGWTVVSDVSIGVVFVGAAASLLAGEGMAAGAQDMIVVAESVLWSNALSTLTMMAVRRPRPYAYGGNAPIDKRTSGHASLSFFSGHTAGAFAASLATFETLRLADRPRLAWATLGVSLAGASFVGVSRVAAGDHFPSDVLAGALVGTSLGMLIPRLHSRRLRLVPAVGGADVGAAIAGTW